MSEKAPEALIDQCLDEIAEEEVIKQNPDFEVPYDWLTIETNAREENGDTIHLLFNERGEWNGRRPAEGEIQITIQVKKDHPDLALTRYALKTADDRPERDP